MDKSHGTALCVHSAGIINDIEQMKKNAGEPRCILLFVCSGSLSFGCLQKQYVCKAGDVILYDERDHDISFAAGDAFFSAYVIVIGGLASRQAGVRLKKSMPNVPSSGGEDYMYALSMNIKALYQEWMHKSMGYEEVMVHYLEIVFAHLLRRVSAVPEKNWAVIPKSKDICGSIRDYIDNNYHREINFEKLAAEFFISYNYLSRAFKKRTGYSPINYLTKTRIGMAKVLLVSTDMSVQDIAVDVGYENGSYLSVAFKKQVGVSPTEFRLASKRQV